MQSSRHPLKPTMNQLTYRMNQDENNYTQIYNKYSDEYYDQYYDFDCDDQQYEYEDAMGRPYFDSAIRPPSLSYVVNRVAAEQKAIRQQEKIVKLKKAALEARHKAYEAAVFAAEVKARKNDFKNEQLSFFRSQLVKLSLDEIAKSVREKVYTDETECKIANEVLLSKLPKFSSATLAKMKAEEEKRNVVEANAKFYTWRKGVSASSTDRNAWGHRRNGGGKGHKATLQELNSEALAVERAAARRIRRKTNSEKEVVEETERSKTIARVNAQRAELEAKKAAELAALQPIVVTLPVEETEWQKFKREELEAFRVKIATTDYSVVAKPEPLPVAKWQKIEPKSAKVAAMLTKALYTKAKNVTTSEFAPQPMSKLVTATQMCRSVSKGIKCMYPPGKCNFAHSFEQLNPKKCGNSCCRFIKKIGDKLINKGNKVCTFIHEGETKSNLCNRIGVRVPDVIIAPVDVTKLVKIAGVTPMGTKVLRPYSATQAWAPVN